MIISPLFLNITFKTSTLKNNDDNQFFLTTLLKALGIVLANVDCCPIELSGIRFSRCYSTLDGIRSLVFLFREINLET